MGLNDPHKFYFIEPNDYVAINIIIESWDAIFDEHKLSFVLRPSQRPLPQPRKSKRHGIPKDFKPDFQIYLIEGTKDEEAINDKMDSIMGNNTWVLTDLPPGCRPLGCNWIFKRKLKVDGTVEKFKARLVIQGFKQKSRIEYFDTYAPVARISTIRLLIAMASIHCLIIHQMDVKTTFLNGELEEEVYMNQPLGFILPGNENKVCKLVKSLYGLKQAPKQWHQKPSLHALKASTTHRQLLHSTTIHAWKLHIGDENFVSMYDCTTRALKAAYAHAYGKLISLSEQQFVDRANDFDNFGCKGGLPSQAYEYINYNGGLDSEEAYPYSLINFSELTPLVVGLRRKDIHQRNDGFSFVTHGVNDGGENPTVEQVRKRAKWDNDDYVCRGLIPNDILEAKYMAEDASSKKFLVSNFINYKMTDSRPVLEQYNELLGILGRFTQHNINMDESIKVSCIIDKLPPSWKDFKHTLKHLKEELTLIELGSHLRIEESLRAQDNDKPKGNNVAGPSFVNMVEHKTPPEDGSSNPLKGQSMFNKSHLIYYVTYVSEGFFVHDDDVACGLHATPSLGNKKYFVTFIDDAYRAVVRLPDPKLEILGVRGIECIFVGYTEHSKAFRILQAGGEYVDSRRSP
ncbi:zinc finger, CCHC-type containing protein [Tanacetum coccineum]|uniref:Zinc finger, CCHC-type containing protein n=1 Tax=Tanacetum coccineum TaxID=301880 RepID=A0ABQ5HXB3_9ASTR